MTHSRPGFLTPREKSARSVDSAGVHSDGASPTKPVPTGFATGALKIGQARPIATLASPQVLPSGLPLAGYPEPPQAPVFTSAVTPPKPRD